jgi:hypothetical protein
MKPITYSLQFRGQTSELGARLRKQASAPGGALVTSLTRGGVAGCFVWAPAVDEAFFESTLVFADAERFDERGTIVFAPGHALRVGGRGRLVASRDPHLRHGAVIWEVVGGEGQFANASGRITSNFFLSDTGDLTENQLGIVFTGGETPSRAALGELDQGCPRRERASRRETLDA